MLPALQISTDPNIDDPTVPDALSQFEGLCTDGTRGIRRRCYTAIVRDRYSENLEGSSSQS